jgi:TPR repeat protein
MERPLQARSYDPDFTVAFGADAEDFRQGGYRFARSTNDPVPLFLSDPDGVPDPLEFTDVAAIRQERSPWLRVTAALTGVAAVVALSALTWSSLDDVRAALVNAKASLAGAPEQNAIPPSAQGEPPRLTAADIQIKDPARHAAPDVRVAAAGPAIPLVAGAPSREEIASAYQIALQKNPPATPAIATAPASPEPEAIAARRMAPDEVAALMKRARSLLAVGDIASARLLLERAAEADEPAAAFLLAQTYDPAVLGTDDARNVTPDPAMARSWYEKAVRFGSADAQQRLAQMQN